MLLERASELTDVTLYHLHTEGIVDYAKPEFKNSFKVRNLFVGANKRKLIDFDRVDYIPCFLSERPSFFRNQKIKLDYAFIQTSPIDKNAASLIEDGSCMQMGIGSIPNAVLDQLRGYKDLGLHSEMCSDGVLPLLESGVINNSKKKFHNNSAIEVDLTGQVCVDSIGPKIISGVGGQIDFIRGTS